ncbi:Forkhead box protein L2 [Phlyctochytrium planicorne]|nr:Forkhead box protein L2 [Phlyctochytrium planicorne]
MPPNLFNTSGSTSGLSSNFGAAGNQAHYGAFQGDLSQPTSVESSPELGPTVFSQQPPQLNLNNSHFNNINPSDDRSYVNINGRIYCVSKKAIDFRPELLVKNSIASASNISQPNHVALAAETPAANAHLGHTVASSSRPAQIKLSAKTLMVRKNRLRGGETYASIIADIILATPEKKALLTTIIVAMNEKFPEEFPMNETGWQNSVRHNLSIHSCFKKEKPNRSDIKSSWWTVDPSFVVDGVFCKSNRRTRVIANPKISLPDAALRVDKPPAPQLEKPESSNSGPSSITKPIAAPPQAPVNPTPIRSEIRRPASNSPQLQLFTPNQPIQHIQNNTILDARPPPVAQTVNAYFDRLSRSRNTAKRAFPFPDSRE